MISVSFDAQITSSSSIRVAGQEKSHVGQIGMTPGMAQRSMVLVFMARFPAGSRTGADDEAPD
jgi:hypothetical protein